MSTTNRRLPKELIALIHFVELNKAGWKEQTVDQLLVYLLHHKGRGSSRELCTLINQEFGVLVSRESVEARLKALAEKDILKCATSGQFQLSEAAAERLMSQLAEADAVEEEVRAFFTHLTQRHGLALTWDDFQDELLLPLVRESGARTYQLLAGILDALPDLDHYQRYIRALSPSEQRALERVIEQFFDGSNQVVRHYILQNIYAYFSLQVMNLEESSLQAIRAVRRKTAQMRLFVDTNFLFSLLNLHENPSNEAAVSLKELMNQLGDTVQIRMYVLPDTVIEAKRTLAYYEERLTNIRVGPNVVEGLLSSSSRVSGIIHRYLEAVRQSGYRLDAKEYMRPYSENLLTILNQHGVELYPFESDVLRQKQEVYNDILYLHEFEIRTRGDKAKSYETIAHDVVLWHTAKSMRSPMVENPLEAGCWVVTVDFRFLGFDAYKRRRNGSSVPICVHPSSLIQMLYFWIPRSEQSEVALVKSLRSMIPTTFDGEVERVTLKILEAVSRFENTDEFDVATLTQIFVNDALYQKLRGETTIAEQIEYVREALAKEAAELRQRLASVSERNTQLERELRRHVEDRLQLEEQVRGFSVRLEEKEHENEELRRELLAMKSEVARIREEKAREMEESLTRRTQRQFIVIFTLSFLGAVTVLELLSRLALGRLWSEAGWFPRVMLAVLLFWTWSQWMEKQITQNERLKDWKLAKLFRTYRAKAVSLLWGFLQSLLSDHLGSLLGQ